MYLTLSWGKNNYSPNYYWPIREALYVHDNIQILGFVWLWLSDGNLTVVPVLCSVTVVLLAYSSAYGLVFLCLLLIKKKKIPVRTLLSLYLQVVRRAGRIAANMLLSNLPFRFFFPSFPLSFPSQPGRVFASGSAGEHGLTHPFEFRSGVRPSLHLEHIPDVQLRQPRAQS